MSNFTFFKVIKIKVDLLESTIVNERHFSTLPEAESFASGCPSDVICVVVQM